MDDRDSLGLTELQYFTVYRQTREAADVAGIVQTVDCFFENYVGELVHGFAHDLVAADKLENCAFFCYLASQSLVFDWLSHSLQLGAYDIVLRELRTILESAFPVYYVDVTYPDKGLDEKFALLNDLERSKQAYGRVVFEQSGLEDWEQYYALFRELCAYTHFSMRAAGTKMMQVAMEGHSDALDPAYDREALVRCADTWRRVAEVLVMLAVSLLRRLGIEPSETACRLYWWEC